MTRSAYLALFVLFIYAALWNSTLTYAINWRKVAAVFCVLVVAVTGGLMWGGQ